MGKRRTVLVVCEDAALIRILSAMSVDVVSSSTVRQAKEIIARRDIQLILCDEALADGSFRDLVVASRASRKKPNVIVIFRVGEWAEYMEALQLGAFEVVPCPLRSVDVEMAVVHGLRNNMPEPLYNEMTA